MTQRTEKGELSLKRKSRYINASEIGTTEFCDMAFYNQLNRVKTSRLNQSHITRGNIAHEEVTKIALGEGRKPFWLLRLFKWILRLFKK